MNQTIFDFFFSLSQNATVVNLSIFASEYLTYVLYVLILVFIFYKVRPFILPLCVLVGTGVSAYIISKILKNLFQIPRPFVEGNFMPIIAESGYSMPSSHATVFAALTTIAFSLDRKLGFVFLFSTLAIGISRLTLGVHYPLDVLFGFILGTLIGLTFLRIGKSKTVVAFFAKYL